jgi:hypothetical protein
MPGTAQRPTDPGAPTSPRGAPAEPMEIATPASLPFSRRAACAADTHAAVAQRLKSRRSGVDQSVSGIDDKERQELDRREASST